MLAGATGDLGFRIAQALPERGARVRALVRPGNIKPQVMALQDVGAEIIEVNFYSVTALTTACAGASCVLSALSGLRPVIVDMQKRLLDAPASRYAALGAGSNTIWVDPGHDLVIGWRWHNGSPSERIKRVLAAPKS